MLAPILFLLAAIFALRFQKKMKRSTRVWVLLVLTVSTTAIVTAGISWDAYVRKAPAHSVLDGVCLFTAFIATISILPSLIWATMLVALKKWEESIAVFLILLVGLTTFWVSTSSWPILRI